MLTFPISNFDFFKNTDPLSSLGTAFILSLLPLLSPLKPRKLFPPPLLLLISELLDSDFIESSELPHCCELLKKLDYWLDRLLYISMTFGSTLRFTLRFVLLYYPLLTSFISSSGLSWGSDWGRYIRSCCCASLLIGMTAFSFFNCLALKFCTCIRALFDWTLIVCVATRL
jgi:hypothetical protein